MVKAGWVIAIVVVLYILAYVAPGAITAMQGADTNNKTDSFIASATEDTDFTFTLVKTPIVPLSETVRLNTVAVASSTYDINYTTGALLLQITPATTGDDVTVSYLYTRDLGAIWPILSILAVIAVLYVIWGLTKRRA